MPHSPESQSVMFETFKCRLKGGETSITFESRFNINEISRKKFELIRLVYGEGVHRAVRLYFGRHAGAA